MPHPSRTAVILLNPAARRAARFDPPGALRLLHQWGVDARFLAPASSAEHIVAARDAARDGVDIVFVAGGDGALRLAAGELAGTGTALAPIPVGTANVWAREIGTPSRWDRAIEAHLQGQCVPMDLGRADGRPFMLMAGIGWDAAIASRVSLGLKRRIGPGAYVAQAARAIPRLRPVLVSIEVDGQTADYEAGLVVLGNTRLYGGVVEFTPGAVADDGMLDICIAGPRHRGEGTRLAANLAMHRLQESAGIHFSRASRMTILTPGIDVQLDGDPVGQTPVHIEVERQALLASLPAGPLPPALAGSSGGSPFLEPGNKTHPKG